MGRIGDHVVEGCPNCPAFRIQGQRCVGWRASICTHTPFQLQTEKKTGNTTGKKVRENNSEKTKKIAKKNNNKKKRRKRDD